MIDSIEWTLLSCVVCALVTGISTYLISRKLHTANCKLHIQKAQTKAKAIEYEAEVLLNEARMRVKELELNAKIHHEHEVAQITKQYESYISHLETQESKNKQQVDSMVAELNIEKNHLRERKHHLEDHIAKYQKIRNEYQQKLEEITQSLCHIASLTREQAKEMAIARAMELAKQDIATLARKFENQAKEEARKKANYILAQATTRYAGEFASERLINVVPLPNDELKGRLIGKEGRNIKSLEMVLGVDVIIDDTPNAIVLSSFNLYRRAIATRVVERLVEDGRIQPARIEEIYERVKQEYEDRVLEEGDDIVLKLGLGAMHHDIKRLIGKLKYRASYGQNALGHSLEVAHLAGLITAELGGNVKIAKRAGLLHDIGKALTHEYEGSHVTLGEEVCKRCNEHPIVINAILAHHGHEEIRSIECAAVCAADALSSARPGARREVLESFLTRVKEIENIALSKSGVLQAYAINAGRELRVIVNAEVLSDDESVSLSREIAKEIESNVQYPGDVKVSVIREMRAVSMAH